MKKYKDYIIVGLIILAIFIVLFVLKGIFPFGQNTLIWGDMYDQVAAFYYHFYDVFMNGKSIFIDFSTSGSINFFGVMMYYLFSPLSFLVLLFPRDNIYQVISIIVVLKFILAGMSSLYLFKKFFPKLPNYVSIVLSLLYAFSGYNLIMYQIIGWLDVVYLFPLLLIGLKNVLDGKNNWLYIVTLVSCFATSFYITGLLLIIIVLASYLYIKMNIDKENQKKAIIRLGITTFFSLGISMVFVFPTYKQLSASSRTGINFYSIANSKVGPFIDKISFLMNNSLGIIMYILLLIKKNKTKIQKKVTKFITIILLLLFIPFLVEPVNMMLHMGSYALFPLRIGFVINLVLLIAAAYYFENFGIVTKFKEKFKNVFNILLGLITLVYGLLLVSNYSFMQSNISKISVGSNGLVLLILLIIFTFSAIAIYYLLYKNKGYDKKLFKYIGYIVIINLFTTSFFYIGMSNKQNLIHQEYHDMNLMEKSYNDDYYRVKNIIPRLVMNYGMVTRYHTYDHFTSLTDADNMLNLKMLGHSSYWVKTYSRGGTLFSDWLLGNKYLLTEEIYNNEYYDFSQAFGKFVIYKNNQDISYGYKIKKDYQINKTENSFDIQNNIYQAITNKDDNIIDIYDDKWVVENLFIDKQDDYTYYNIINNSEIAYLEKFIDIPKKATLYLDFLKSYDNNINKDILGGVNIYINGKLKYAGFAKDIDNGLLDLGMYDNSRIKIRIEFQRNVALKNLQLGILENRKYENFVNTNNIGLTLNYENNKILVKTTSLPGERLVLPIAYNEGYSLKINGNNKELKSFNNFLEITLEEGENDIELKYMSPGFKVGLIITVFSILLTITIYYFKIDQILINNNIIQSLANIALSLINYLIILIMYLIPIILFVISFFVNIRF